MHSVTAREIALVGLFAALTAVGAIFSIQLGNAVPFTLQLMFTVLAGAVLGSRLGSLSQVSYVLMGLIGLPVFSMRRAGIGQLVGPTGGFLIGFIAAAWVTGWLVERFYKRGSKTGPLVVFVAMVVGVAVSYIPGIGWLAWHMGGVVRAAVSMTPFIPVDLMKAIIGAAVFMLMDVRGLVPRTHSAEGQL